MVDPQSEDRPTAWTFQARATLACVAVSPGSAWSAVADSERTVSVMDPAGRAVGTFRGGQPVRRLRINADGTLFTALAGESVVYAFNRRGQMEWRVEFGGPVVDFALSADGELLAGVSDGGWLYTYSPEDRDRRVLPVGRPMTCLALLDGGDPRVLVGGPKGKLCLLGADGKPRWQVDLGGPAGSISVAEGPGTVVAVGGSQAKVFTLSGEPAGHLTTPSAAVRAELAPDGSAAVVETASGRLLVMDMASGVREEHELPAAGAPWDLGAGGGLLVAASGPEEARAVPLSVPAGLELAESEEIPGWPAALEVEEDAPLRTVAPTGPMPSAETRCQVVWKKGLPGAAGEVSPELFRVSTTGSLTLCGLASGVLLGMDAAGELILREEVPMPARMLPTAVGRQAVVLSGNSALVVSTADGSCRRTDIEGPSLVHADCPDDATIIYGVDEDGGLGAFGPDGVALWHRDMPEPAGLLVSPDGALVAVPCGDGRFRYYDPDGRLVRKTRFPESEAHHLAALGEEYSVFSGGIGRLTLIDSEGRRLWSRRIMDQIERLELLGSALAVYGPEGSCGIVDPESGDLHEMNPPPGMVRVRAPLGGDVIAVHATGSAVTAFRGFRRKLGVAWRHDCGDDVTLLDVAWSGRQAVVVAGRKVLMIRGAG